VEVSKTEVPEERYQLHVMLLEVGVSVPLLPKVAV
jgi:hypothetical protein